MTTVSPFMGTVFSCCSVFQASSISERYCAIASFFVPGLIQGPGVAQPSRHIVRRELHRLPKAVDRLGQMDLGRLLLGRVVGLHDLAERHDLRHVAEP